jgi:hypothetical protein
VLEGIASMFFFEKKNQKTFIRLRRSAAPVQHRTDEVFFASFFFRKKKTLP